MNLRFMMLPLATVAVLGGCVSIPAGPTVMVLPGPHKSFEQFQAEDLACRNHAQNSIAPAGKAAQDHAASSAVAGTAVGAAAGAMIGAASGQPGSGAAIGAGTGLVVGSAAASEGSYGSSYELQRSYDVAYMQCMYARGNQLPNQVVPRSSSGYPPAYPPPNTPPPR